MASELPIHFFTLVLNGEPFIRYHLERFKALKCPWHWHVIEGLAELKYDTAWSLKHGATIPPDVAKDGRSVDGTAAYLDEIARENPGQVTVYRAPNGRMWDGKLEMVNAVLGNLPEECLLFEVDSDELWTTEQMEKVREMFLKEPERTAAVFHCWYFVAPDLVIDRRRRFQELEWRRAWRYRKGMRWLAHEPPKLGMKMPGGEFEDITRMRPFTPYEMDREGLVFQHFAYVTEAQLAFKETYYGYKGVTEQWRRLQQDRSYPVQLRRYFDWPWVNPRAVVNTAAACGLRVLAHQDAGGTWRMEMGPEPPAPKPFEFPRMAAGARAKRGVLYLTWGGMEEDLKRSVETVQMVHPELPIHVQELPAGSTLLDKARMFALSPFEETLYLDADTVVYDRLDFGFEMAKRHGLACVISDCPWARRYEACGDRVEYDTGVLFFTQKAKGIFEAWEANVRKVASSFKMMVVQNGQRAVMKLENRDQAGFAAAVAGAALSPFVLPMNWNFRPRTQTAWWGPIKVWHDREEPLMPYISFFWLQSQPGSIVQFVRQD